MSRLNYVVVVFAANRKMYNRALFSESCVYQIKFELVSISDNRSSKNRGFTVYTNLSLSIPI